MVEVLKALGFIALGMALSEVYNRRIWKGYRDGQRDQSSYQHNQHNYHRTGAIR